MALNWINPGTDERAVTAEFLQSDEARQLRPGLSEPPLFDADRGQFVSNGPKARNLLAAEKDYEDQGKDRWHRIWYGMADKTELVTPWIEIIPNEYGLAIVKAGVAVILKLAKKSLEKRKKVLQAFEEIQKAMMSANPLKGSFRSHPGVAVALDDLHKAIVDSVNDMLVLTAKEEHSFFQLLSEKTQGLKDAIENAHYQSIESTEMRTKSIEVGTASVIRGVSHLDGKVDLQTEEIHRISVATQEQNALLMGHGEKLDGLKILFEALQNEKEVIADAHLTSAREGTPSDLGSWFMNKITDVLVAHKKDSELQKYISREAHAISGHRRRAVINELQFCEAIADAPFHEDERPDIEGFAIQPDNDWGTVTRYSGDFDSRTQSQVQSIFQQGRFLGWMRSKYPDLVLILADLPASGTEGISPVSVFCATLVSSLTNIRREDLVLHFFCGLHVDSCDPNPGPRGLVRSLIMQLFAYLSRTGCANLDFICDRGYELLFQCEPGTHVYCIIDSLTLFERDVWFRDLKKVAKFLQEFVENEEMPAVLKVMLTSSALCTPELKDLFTAGHGHRESVLYLSEDKSFVDGDFGEDEMEHHLAQMSLAPRPGGKPDAGRSYRQCYKDYY
ncbi:hypothetical protein J7T55_001276 [Diaporthe amygdali]|uniref:uncharacterized protein n=1 Tax=Phomopsis amygdali TaxID=1214568 RepID=UPI0022FEAF4E|nr:uncharacterized protein J7T55_001276 [Diaporthe amygdali]KAJ0106752.1 hypothetical protein J7T55_001276 [Diaporthe amygdali]